MEAATLEALNHELANSAFYGTFIFVPVVDGTYIVERPTVTLAKGKLNGVRDHLHYVLSLANVSKASTARREQPERGKHLC